MGLATAIWEHETFWGAFSHDASVPLAAVAFWIFGAVAGMWHVLPRALISARTLRPDMNLLMVLAATGAMAIGDYSEGASVAFLFSLANQLESWSMGRARKAIQALMDITPTTALVLNPGALAPHPTPVEKVPAGSMVLVRPGDSIPLDGLVVAGSSSVDQSPITGESMPVPKAAGDTVYAGTINAEGAMEIRTTAAASDSALSRIMHMVEEAQSKRAKAVQWVDKFAAVYTPAMMGLSILVALAPPLFAGGEWTQWFYQALVVLVISCPCALVISTPVSVVAGLASAARNGVLIKGGAYLEAAASITAVALDKTGTLTKGKPAVTQIDVFAGTATEELLATAASLESRSSHPVARAILDHALGAGLHLPTVEDVLEHPGRGAQGRIEGKLFFVGNERLLGEQEPALLTQELRERFLGAHAEASTVVAVWNGSKVLGTLTLKDTVRPEAQGAVESLRQLGMAEMVMLSGDNEQTASLIARQTGVTGYRANLLPEDKTAIVTDMVARGTRVAMVGDGVNDAPALAASSLGIAMGGIGTGAAIETADVALMSDDLSKLPWLIRHSRRTVGIIKQNIGFALGLKAVFLILAFFQVATLWAAIAADMGASLAVIFNGLRLLRIRK
jgi:Cd2+/Zn2+-exporting ATPase